VDEREAHEREILAGYLAGTPVEGDEGQMSRLYHLDLIDRLRAMSIIAGAKRTA
jgi:hypothetical protein